MNDDFSAAMRRASELVRAGDTAGATSLIQSLLGRASPTSPDPQASAPQAPQGLGKALAELKARMPRVTTPGFTIPGLATPEPAPPEGARFDGGTFNCAAGSRDYRVYLPRLDGAAPTGLVMMLHGCTQNPVDFANGTDMNRLAEEHGLIIIYPAQARGANMQSCWNWFSQRDQQRGAGEPEILAGLASRIREDHEVPHDRIFVAGLSAGAAMAVILGRVYPDVFTAVGAHSGLPYGSASDMPSALATMAGNAPASPRKAESTVPTIIFHGSADTTVHPSNGQRIADDIHPSGTEIQDSGMQGGRRFTRRMVLSRSGSSTSEHWSIEGLGHAWSGGNPAGSYVDASGPDASAEMLRFFLDLPRKGN